MVWPGRPPALAAGSLTGIAFLKLNASSNSIDTGSTYYIIAVCLLSVYKIIQAVPLTVPGLLDEFCTFTTCSLPYLSPAWIWTSGLTVFVVPTIIITICYTLMMWKMHKDKLAITEDSKDTLFLFALTIVFFLCWWPTCIYLSVK